MPGKPTYEELQSRISDLENADLKRKQAEAALRESEKKLNRFLRNVPLPYQSLDENGNFLEVNQFLQDVLGYTREELIGRNFGDFLHPDWVDHFKENFPRFKAVGEVLGVEFEMIKKDGNTLLVSFNGKIQRDDQNHFQRTHCIFQDITERRQAENSLRASEKKYRTLFENMAQGVFYQNAEGVLIDYNNAALEMFGLTDDQFMGKTSLDPQWKVISEDGTELPGDKHPSMLALQTGKPVQDAVVGVYNPRTKSFKWLVVNAIPQFSKAGEKPCQVFVTLQDITDRKQSEEALHQSENKLRSTLDATPFPVAVVDLKDDKIFYWSSSALTLFGHTAPTASEWYQIAYPDPDYRKDVIERWKPFLEIAKASGHPVNTGEYQITCKDGSVKICELYASFLPDSLIVTFNDITDRKKAEESLFAIEWLLNKPLEKLSNPAQYYGNLTALNTNRLILDNIGDEVLSDIVTGYLELLETSAAVYESNGDYAQGIFSSGWCRMLDSASRSLCETESNNEALASGKWLCHESCWMDASKVSIETGEPMDIDCRGGLKIYAVPIKANDTVIGSINFGYGDPPKSMSQIEQIAETYKVDPAELLRQANLYERRPPFIIEIAKKRVQSSARLIAALVESKIAQSELKREKEKLNVTLHSIGDGVITTDNIGNVVLVNTVAETLTGWTQEEARGKLLDVVFHIINEHTRQRCENPVEKVLETNGIVGLANHTVLVSRDGTERIIADSGAPIIDQDQSTIGVVLVFRDITEQSKMEIELQHAHKMEAIGTLAGGIAHDFNNILAAVLGYADMAMDDIPKHSPARYQIEQVLKAGNRAKDLVKHILSFSRKESQVRVPLEVGKILQEALKFLRATIPTTIEIKESHDIENGIILADATQLHQVIVNLCTNAAHAMEEQGGILGITLSSQNLSENEIKKEPSLKPGPYVRLCVSDTGTGIDQKHLDKIFDPYFTTKEVGKGSGMGLAVVVGIVRSHDGIITVDSTRGEGATFNVYFPRIEEQSKEEAEVTAPLPVGNEKILVVDDEESIVYMTKRRLELLGYQVTAKTSSIEALELFRSQPDQFDLVITDQTMPGLTGEQLAKELLSIKPGFPIILCTGYSSKIDAEKADFIGIRDFIMKPVERSELANTVRRILDTK
jgi:PAS domain S-box-containing protein